MNDGAAGLEKMKDLGTIEVKGTVTPIKYAYSRSMGPGAGRRVTVALGRMNRTPNPKPAKSSTATNSPAS